MKFRLLSLLTIAFFLLNFSAFAQMTTSSIAGKIKDAKNEDVIGATIIAVHTPTGTKYGTVSDENGTYSISDMTPGGPYKITVTFVGAATQDLDNINLSLGPNNGPTFSMKDQTTEITAVLVTAERGGTTTGAGTRIGEEQIKTLPSLSRSLQDLTRLTPQSSNNSFAGTNFRYNNVTIDGTINNDAIGFSPSLGGASNTSGMVGSSTRTNGISADAIQDVQVLLAPFDVKIGNVLGGSINAVTRSGTNDVHGSVYGFFRNNSLTGPANAGDGSKISSDYQDYQTGVRVGLPIIKNKLFWFTNEEITNRTEPTYYNADGSKDANGAQISLLDPTTAQQITDFVKNKYGFDVGAYGTSNIYSKSTKFFNRIDWNINDNNILTLRNNTVVSEATNLERDAANFRFASMDFKSNNNSSSTVAELKSHFGNKLSNSLVLGYSTVHDYRTPLSANVNFPQTEISYNGGTILLGNDREATVFNMQQNTFEFTDNVTLYAGKNKFTFGTHNEFYNLNYGFVNALNGRLGYKSVADFLASNVNRVRGTFSLDDANNNRDYIVNNPYAKYNVSLLSLYGQDEIELTKNLKVSGGLRLDYATSDSPLLSPKVTGAAASTYAGTTYSNTPVSSITNTFFKDVDISPRVGFNWDVNGDRSLVVRGGTGTFVGRIPFAWLGYAFYNDGVGYGSYDVNNVAGKNKGDILTSGPNGTPGPKQFAYANGQGNKVQADLIDNNFKMPQIWRSSLAVDYTVSGYKFTLEGLYTKVLRDLKFQQVNLKDSVQYYAYDTQHQMPIYLGSGDKQRIDPNFSNAYMLSNTDQGERYSLTGIISKSYTFNEKNMLNVYAAYTYGVSKDLTNGIRNSMESNWQLNQSLTPNNPVLAYSNFDIRNRIVANVSYKLAWSAAHQTTLGLVFTSQSGSPFTWGIVNGTIAGTPQAAGLVYIPKDVAEATTLFKDITGGATAATQAQNFMNFVAGDTYLSSRQGNFTERNGGRTPWNTNLDLRLLHDISFKVGDNKVHTIELSLDIFNFTNLLNKDWGWSYFVPNTFNSTSSVGLNVAAASKIDGTTNPTYSWKQPLTPYSIDQLASRWQMQLGARYSF